MRIIRILTRESPLSLAREVMWRATRGWRKRRILARIEHPGDVKFRYIPYYDPDLQCLSEHTKTLIVAFADEIQAGRYPFWVMAR